MTTPAKTDIRSLIQSEQYQKQFAACLPQHLPPERFARVALTALTRTPKLADCTPASLMKCLLDLSAMGLEPDGRVAHLIPYGKECTLRIDYKGLIELVRRSGDIVSIRAETVCEKDEFDWQDGVVTHRINWRAPRGEVQAAYTIAALKTGETQTAVMTREEIEAIRARSPASQSGPWVTDWAEMAKKTTVRRLCKMLPLSSEIQRHIEADDRQFMRNVTPDPGEIAPAVFNLPLTPAEPQPEPAETGDGPEESQ